MNLQTDEEAVRLANDSPNRTDRQRLDRRYRARPAFAEGIDAGTVMVNEVLYTHGIGLDPLGWRKTNGRVTRMVARACLKLVSARHIHVNRISFIPDLWWFRYTPDAAHLFRALPGTGLGLALPDMLLLPQ